MHAKTRRGHVVGAEIIVGHIRSLNLVARLHLCIDDISNIAGRKLYGFSNGPHVLERWKGEEGDGLAMKCGAIQVN